MELQKIDHPARFSWVQQSNVVAHVAEYLTQTGSDNITRPYLLEKWEASEDIKTWTLFLRKGVKFHNGNSFTAADVKYTFERLTNPEVSQFVNDGKAIASIETPDDYTVIVKTKDPIPWFIDNMHQVFIMDFVVLYCMHNIS